MILAICAYRHRTLDCHKALYAKSKTISEAPNDYGDRVVYDGYKWTLASQWRHWSMAEPVWWSNQYGEVHPTRFVNTDTMVSLDT